MSSAVVMGVLKDNNNTNAILSSKEFQSSKIYKPN